MTDTVNAVWSIIGVVEKMVAQGCQRMSSRPPLPGIAAIIALTVAQNRADGAMFSMPIMARDERRARSARGPSPSCAPRGCFRFCIAIPGWLHSEYMADFDHNRSLISSETALRVAEKSGRVHRGASWKGRTVMRLFDHVFGSAVRLGITLDSVNAPALAQANAVPPVPSREPPEAQSGSFTYHGHHYHCRKWVADHEKLPGYWQCY